MRVLTKIHEKVNEECFDILKKQRLTLPLARNAQATSPILLARCHIISSQKLQSVKGEELFGVIGEFVDFESIIALKDLLNRFDRTGVPQLLQLHNYQYITILNQLFLDKTPQSLNLSNKLFQQTLFKDLIDNFDMADTISRQSVTMAKCSTAFNSRKFSTFKQL